MSPARGSMPQPASALMPPPAPAPAHQLMVFQWLMSQHMTMAGLFNKRLGEFSFGDASDSGSAAPASYYVMEADSSDGSTELQQRTCLEEKSNSEP